MVECPVERRPLSLFIGRKIASTCGYGGVAHHGLDLCKIRHAFIMETLGEIVPPTMGMNRFLDASLFTNIAYNPMYLPV